MELKKVNIQNKGMSQDYSISKDNQEYAFKNKNVRIQALDDGTLLSITNIKGPKKIPVDISIEGTVVGKCFTGNYLVLFTCLSRSIQKNPSLGTERDKTLNYIYRIDLRRINNIKVNLLYSGYLGFELDRTFDTTFYYENANIQKVYWVESWYSEELLKALKKKYPNNIYQNNGPRVINIITEGERVGEGFTLYTDNVFEFYPEIGEIPQFKILKDRSVPSQHPSGIIQYFISYYLDNGAETLIANNSSTFTIDHMNKGAKADETGVCGFKITIKNVNTKFDYFRIYSAIRTSKDGPLLVKIVGDTKINKSNPNAQYTILDTGINQETISDTLLFFIGGTPLYANTIELKNDTVFLGNIKTPTAFVPNELKSIIDNRKIYYYEIKTKAGKKIVPFKYDENSPTKYITTLLSYKDIHGKEPDGFEYGLDYSKNYHDGLFFSECVINPKLFNIIVGNSDRLYLVDTDDIYFTIKGDGRNLSNKYYKGLTTLNSMFSPYYNYRLQTGNSSKRYKTFKGGEMYRFGIQFQNKLGLWTDVVWLGDKECETYPIVDNENYLIHLNNAVYQIPELVKQSCRNLGFDNYRIVIANPENLNGRRIQAQGVVCPTLFSPGQRALGNAYSISSWIMRPKGMACSHHHFEPITSSFANKGGEIFGIDIGKFDPVEGVTKIPEGYPGIKYNEDGSEKYRSTHGGKWYTSPYYLTSTESLEIYDTSDAPKYLVIQMSVHSGHKIAFKATPVASDYMSTCLWNPVKNKYDYVKDNENILTYEVNYGAGGWGKIQEELTENFINRGWDPHIIPSEKVLRKIGARLFWGEFLTILTLVTAIIAVVALTLLTGGLAAVVIGLILAIVAGSVAVVAGVTGASSQNAWTNVVGKLKYDWQKELFYKGFIQMDTDYKNRQSQNCIIFGNGRGFLPKELASAGLNLDRPNAEVDEWEADGDNTASAIHFLNIIPLSGRRYDALEAESEFSKFYVDESIVTFHSPDIENCRDKNLQFRIVGTAPINSLYSNLDIQTSTPPLLPNGGLDNYRISNYKKIQSDDLEISGILSGGYFYWDSQINNTGPAGGSIDYFLPNVGTLYKIFLWDKSGTITGGKDSMPLGSSTGNPIGPQLPSIIKSKTILNQLNSFGNYYFKLKDCVSYQYPSIIKVCNETDSVNFINNKNKILIYKNNYDHLITYKRAVTSHIEYDHTKNYDISEGESIVVAGPSVAHTVRIKYNSSEHGVFDLYSLLESKKFLLPCVEGEVPYKVGNVNYKNEEDHLWHEGGNVGREVDTCWTHLSEWYIDDVYFKIIPVLSNISWLQDHVKDTLNREFTLTDITISKLYLSNKKPVHLGFVCFDINIHSGSDFEDLSTSFILELLKGKSKKPGKHTFFVNGRIYSGYVNYFKYVLKDILTDENGYIKEVKGYFTTKHNDYIYCTGSDIAKGRFNWITNGDSGDGLHPYIDFPIKYELPKIDASLVPNSKYLFVGELFYDLKPNLLYGGFNNIENLLWYPVSKITPIDKNVHETEGDTYYQRWDCLKTYPTTTEDETNKVVDITSFMVESHKNLDGRTDPNRDLYNIMSRPENFNLFNHVYDTAPNIFLYSTLRKIPTTEYKNLVVWSFKKNFDAKIDSWTNINLSLVVNAKNSITKIKNFNNSLLLLTDYSIDKINYDEKNFVATDTEYIELANSSKVNGIIQMFSTFGTHNQTTLITEKGFYFIDDNEKSIIRISVDGSINKLAAGKMDSWFKNNVVEGTFTNTNNKALHLEYDPIHKDIYIINNKDCLIYNENLEAFTSFVDYLDCYTLCNCSGSLLALSYNTPEIYEMFGGKYNTTFNDVPIDYSVLYRVNPSPYTDKVFTNVEFIADCSNVNNALKAGYTPFDDILVWNEYQDTLVKPLVFERNRPSNLKQKFRIWRADIPRDANSNWGRDRIRNPWINMTLSKKTNGDDYKLELHSMNVLYME